MLNCSCRWLDSHDHREAFRPRRRVCKGALAETSKKLHGGLHLSHWPLSRERDGSGELGFEFPYRYSDHSDKIRTCLFYVSEMYSLSRCGTANTLIASTWGAKKQEWKWDFWFSGNQFQRALWNWRSWGLFWLVRNNSRRDAESPLAGAIKLL